MCLRSVLSAGIVFATFGCAQPPQSLTASTLPDATAPPAAAPSSTGRARVCETTRTGRYRSGAGTLTAVTVSNEGGWCGKTYAHRGQPFTDGTIVEPPQHGEAQVRHVARRTVVEYRPTPGYVGTDRFTATLTPGNGTYIEEITVQP